MVAALCAVFRKETHGDVMGPNGSVPERRQETSLVQGGLASALQHHAAFDAIGFAAPKVLFVASRRKAVLHQKSPSETDSNSPKFSFGLQNVVVSRG